MAFRGTAGLQDILTDLNFPAFTPTEYAPSFFGVHGGFFDSFVSVAPAFREEMATLVASARCTTYLFTGHSLGGALAQLAAMDFVLSRTNPISSSTLEVYVTLHYVVDSFCLQAQRHFSPVSLTLYRPSRRFELSRSGPRESAIAIGLLFRI